jgi:hypothetical protein
MSKTPLTGRTKLQASSRVLLDWLEAQPPFEDKDGRATTRLYEAATAAGAYSGTQIGMASILKAFDDRGLVTRDINGRRCMRIAVTNPAAPAEVEHAEVEHADGVEVVEAHEVAEVVEQVTEAAERELPARRPPLVGTVHLALDLDPAMARLVLDLVEGADGVVPVSRLDVQLMISRAIDTAAERMTANAERLGERVVELERNVGAAMRQLMTPTNGSTPAPTERGISRPSPGTFKRLGVKDAKQRELLADLVVDGWAIERSNNSHVRVTKEGHKPFSVSSTPSDHRTPDNERTRARRAGANV